MKAAIVTSSRRRNPLSGGRLRVVVIAVLPWCLVSTAVSNRIGTEESREESVVANLGERSAAWRLCSACGSLVERLCTGGLWFAARPVGTPSFFPQFEGQVANGHIVRGLICGFCGREFDLTAVYYWRICERVIRAGRYEQGWHTGASREFLSRGPWAPFHKACVPQQLAPKSGA